MRTLIAAAAVLAFAGIAGYHSSARAGDDGRDFVCWTSTGGFTDCDWLPRGYRVPGVKHANCCNVRKDTDRVEFTLTRRRIRALAAQGVRVDTMAPTHWAQLQAVCRKHKH